MTHCVILLHGLGRTHRSMRKLERSLSDHGYCVWNQSYASTRQAIELSSVNHINRGLHYCFEQSAKKIHFVTHSLGGILLRYYLHHNDINHLGNIIMLSPPNKGSEIADFFHSNRCYQWLTGPAGQQLTTDSVSMPNQLGAIQSPTGVITGRRTSDPWFAAIVPKPSDGKVSVESAKLNGMTDFLVVNCGHTFIMNNAYVIEQVKHFLVNTRFKTYN